MNLVKMEIEYPEHGMVVLTNEGGDTYTSKSEELMDFLHGVKILNKHGVMKSVCEHPRDKRRYVGAGFLKCDVCGLEFK